MAKITYAGQLGSTGVSSGPHLHEYVKNLITGEYEDPAIHKSKFLNVRVGPNRVPKYIQDKSGGLILNPAAGLTLTSGYGARDTGIKGASTYHRGRDLAGKEGTPIYIEGDVKFTPRANAGGYGNLATWTTPDQKYELGYGHMKSLGAASDTAGAVPAGQTTTPGTDQRTEDILKAFMYGAQIKNQEALKEEEPTLVERIKGQLVGNLISQALNPTSFLSSYQNENPFLMGQSAATSDYLNGLFG